MTVRDPALRRYYHKGAHEPTLERMISLARGLSMSVFIFESMFDIKIAYFKKYWPDALIARDGEVWVSVRNREQFRIFLADACADWAELWDAAVVIVTMLPQ